jgi:hypothetical protein
MEIGIEELLEITKRKRQLQSLCRLWHKCVYESVPDKVVQAIDSCEIDTEKLCEDVRLRLKIDGRSMSVLDWQALQGFMALL